MLWRHDPTGRRQLRRLAHLPSRVFSKVSVCNATCCSRLSRRGFLTSSVRLGNMVLRSLCTLSLKANLTWGSEDLDHDVINMGLEFWGVHEWAWNLFNEIVEDLEQLGESYKYAALSKNLKNPVTTDFSCQHSNHAMCFCYCISCYSCQVIYSPFINVRRCLHAATADLSQDASPPPVRWPSVCIGLPDRTQ